MKITALKQQVKRADRYSVYVDGKYVCSFSEGELVKLGLHSGQELSENELNELKQASQADKAYMRALDMVSRRPRSEWEMRDYLRRKNYDSELIDEILNRLKLNTLINDEDFARRWVDNRRLLKSVSKRKLRQELKTKRIAEDLIDQVLAEDQTDERAIIKELIEKKRRRYPDDQKLMLYLARQGFNFDDIKATLADISGQDQPE